MADEISIDDIWAQVVQDPSILDKLSEEEIIALHAKSNPYGHGQPNKLQGVALSYTNVKETYMKRLTVTSLVAFIYQMLHEWEVPKEQRQFKPEDVSTTLDLPTIIGNLEELLSMAKYSAEMSNKAAQTKQAALDADLIEEKSKAEIEAMYKGAEEYADLAAGSTFSLTNRLVALGQHASQHVNAAKTACMAHKESKKHAASLNLSLPEFTEPAAKQIIRSFLDHYLQYDPSVHVRSARNTVPVNTGNLTVEALSTPPEVKPEHQAAYKELTTNNQLKSAIVKLLQNNSSEAAQLALANVEDFKRYLYPCNSEALTHVPPADTFHRFNYYSEVNYEKLKNITEALYPERAALDFAVALWEVFEGATENEVANKFDKHCLENKDKMNHSIVLVNTGTWTMFGNYAKNRENINYYNDGTEVLKAIETRTAKDSAMGKEMMKNRIKQSKAKNIRENGPDDEGLKEYRRTNKAGASMMGAEKVIDPLTMKRLERAKGDIKAAKELEYIDMLDEEISKITARVANAQPGDATKLKDLQEKRINALQMLAVPADSVQVDVFKTDGENFVKGPLFIEAT